MGHRGACAIGTLNKRDVEALLDGYDEDPEAALTTALRIVLDSPDADFDDLVTALAAEAGWDPERTERVMARHVDALDALAADLNEARTLKRLETK